MKHIISCVIVVVLTLVLFSCSADEKQNSAINKNELKKLCQFSTIECHIHACVDSSKKESSWLKRIFNPDAEYNYIVEYDGIFKIGIDFKGLDTDANSDTVTVKISRPHLLDKEIKKDTLSDYKVIVYDEDHLYKDKETLDNEKYVELLGKAQEELGKYIEENKLNYDVAEENAKSLIENYITQIGKIKGIEYKINFEYVSEDEK